MKYDIHAYQRGTVYGALLGSLEATSRDEAVKLVNSGYPGVETILVPKPVYAEPDYGEQEASHNYLCNECGTIEAYGIDEEPEDCAECGSKLQHVD